MVRGHGAGDGDGGGRTGVSRTNAANSVLDVLRGALGRYEGLTLLAGDPVSAVRHKNGAFTCTLESGGAVRASRLVLASAARRAARWAV